jgi:hypothetical protein
MKIYPNVVRVKFQERASFWIARLISAMDAFLRIPLRIPDGKPVEAFQQWLGRYALVRELLSEVRSLLYRIEMICKESVWYYGVDLGRAFETESDADGFLLPCIETDCRTQGIEMLQSKHPWVSSMNMQLFLLGFEAADSMPFHSSCNKSQFRISLFSLSSPIPSTPKPSPSLPQPSRVSLSDSNTPYKSCNGRSVAQEPLSDSPVSLKTYSLDG